MGGRVAIAIYEYLLNAVPEAGDEILGKLPLLGLRLLFLDELSLDDVLCFLSADLGFKIADQIVSLEEILAEVALDHPRELLRVVFAVIQGVLQEPCQLLVVVLWVLQGHWALATLEASQCFAEEPWLGLSLGFRLLHILLLQVGMLLVHRVLAELVAHVGHTHVDVGIERRGLLEQALGELHLLLMLLALRHCCGDLLHLRVHRDRWRERNALVVDLLPLSRDVLRLVAGVGDAEQFGIGEETLVGCRDAHSC